MAKRTRPPQDQGQPEEVELPVAAQALSAKVRDLARRFVGTRRRLGIELLEAARLIAEARALTGHGQWQIFLEATATGDDIAERLINIAGRCAELPDYEEAIRNGRLSESVAWRLAQPSVPLEAVAEVLSEERPLTVRFVKQQLRSLRRPRRADADRGSTRPPRGFSWNPEGNIPPAQEDQIPIRIGIWPPTPTGAGSFGGFPEPPPRTIVSLSEEDWSAAQRLTELLEGCAAGVELLSPADWEVLEPLAKVLARVKRRQGF
jgi:hypothetical protein